MKQCKTQVTRRSLFKEIAGAGLLLTAGRSAWGQDRTSPPIPTAQRERKVPQMKITAMAEAYYIDLIPHNNAGPLGSSATLHAALAIPNITMIEAPWVNGDGEGDVVKPYPTVENGFALPLEGPGLGITFDERLARAKPFRKPGLQPRLNAPDGSVRDF